MLLPLAWVCLAGCTAPGASSGRFVIAPANSGFYKYGPAQAFGPDLALSKGQKVTMINRQFGFSQVRLDDGQTGFVATDDLKPAPPEPKPAPTPALALASRTRAAHLHAEPERPLDLSDVPSPPLPTQDAPAKPSFHAQH